MQTIELISLISNLVLCVSVTTRGFKITNDDASYLEQRKNIIINETTMQIGAGIKLTSDEEIVNKQLMKIKYAELDAGKNDALKILPAMNFLEAKPFIEQSDVFKFIKTMPKGSVLHVHQSAIGSEQIWTDIIMMPNLYICQNLTDKLALVFAKENPNNYRQIFRAPKLRKLQTCLNWTSVAQEQKIKRDVESFIKKFLILQKSDTLFKDGSSIWSKFESIFATIKPLLHYRPAFERYFYRVLEEYDADKVMYLEIRSSSQWLYEANGTVYSDSQVIDIINALVDDFKITHPHFFGIKLIFSVQRSVNETTFNKQLEKFLDLRSKYPSLLIGFDLVGEEDKGRPLQDFWKKLLHLDPTIQFFFHAGETNFYGDTDMNLIDIILLRTKRIGHGFALNKHPLIAKLIKEYQIGIEVSPISNQVLQLVGDLRNHPAVEFFANNYPMVISNDDPLIWGARGLSYDFYEAFMAFTSRDSDLRALKQLAINSIIYSAVSGSERKVLLDMFNLQWNTFIRYHLNYNPNNE